MGFASAKATFTLDLEYHRNAHTRPRLDFLVAVQKSALQSLGKLAADGRFPGPHQTDKINVGAPGHTIILAVERKWAGKAGPSLNPNRGLPQRQGVVDDLGRDKDEQLASIVGRFVLLEKIPQERNITQ